MYAIVDIETTGGHADSNSITEIAIFIFDGDKVTDQFVSLVKPDYPIPPFLEQYTGITNEMVENAPRFEEIADTVFNLLNNNIFVAHNVNFDYSFIYAQLLHSNYKLPNKKLCTVRLSRKIFPGYKSYSLGNICAALGIPIQNRHRAAGDAAATVLLFEKLFKADQDSIIQQSLKKGSKEQVLPPNLPKQQFEALSQNTGIYYFHNQEGKIVYIGKAKNIQKRVATHFSGNKTGKQKQDFLRSIHSISCVEVATELMAFILESIEIKKHWPEFNRALKKLDFNFAIYDYEDRNHYLRLAIDKTRKSVIPLRTFRTQLDAIQTLQGLISRFDLCSKLCGITTTESCLSQPYLTCKGACEQKEEPTKYNSRVQEAIQFLSNNEHFAIIDKGRYADEVSCILVENGRFFGMGYLPIDQYNLGLEEIKMMIQPYKHGFYIDEIIQSHLAETKAKVIRFEHASSLMAQSND